MIDKEIKFPATKEYPKSDIEKTQKRLLEMADIILKILDDNKIKYMITFGTLIGAVRHKGFIPWDDDFDIFLFDDEYDKAIEILRKNLPNDMIVHNKDNDPIYWPYWARVRDANSLTYSQLWPNDNKYKYRGINFDLYRMERIKKKDKDKRVIYHQLTYQDRIRKSGLISSSQCIKNKLKLYPKYLKGIIKSLFSKDNKEIFSFVLRFQSLEIEEVLPLKKYEFENRKVWGPNNYDSILTTGYGDYMKLPPYDERKSHYSWVKFNIKDEKDGE